MKIGESQERWMVLKGLGIKKRSQLLKTHARLADAEIGKMGAPDTCARVMRPGLMIPRGPLMPDGDDQWLTLG
jgi:hypothetical protein